MAEAVPARTGVTVAYDPARLSPERLAEVVTRDTGYRARLLAEAHAPRYP